MEWTTRYFLHRARQWEERLKQPDPLPGPQAYAARQAAQWHHLASDAERHFVEINPDYVKLIM